MHSFQFFTSVFGFWYKWKKTTIETPQTVTRTQTPAKTKQGFSERSLFMMSCSWELQTLFGEALQSTHNVFIKVLYRFHLRALTISCWGFFNLRVLSAANGRWLLFQPFYSHAGGAFPCFAFENHRFNELSVGAERILLSHLNLICKAN